MVTNDVLPLACALCKNETMHDARVFPATDAHIAFYPAKRLVHLHFGRSSWSMTESTLQARWLLKSFHEKFKQFPKYQWFIIVDLQRLDDSAFPSSEAKDVYREILTDNHTSFVVFLGGSQALNFLVRMILRFAHTNVKTITAQTIERAEEAYAKWKMKN